MREHSLYGDNGANSPPRSSCLLFFLSCSRVAECVEQMFVGWDASILQYSTPSADRHLFLRNQGPDLLTGWPRFGVIDRIGQHHSHSQPVRTGTVPAFFE